MRNPCPASPTSFTRGVLTEAAATGPSGCSRPRRRSRQLLKVRTLNLLHLTFLHLAVASANHPRFISLPPRFASP